MNANIQLTKEVSGIEINKIDVKNNIYIVIKRIMDIISGLAGCIILVPLSLIIGIANILAKDKGPIFIVQKRIGKDGKPFKMYKFRSMIVDADKVLKQYLLDNPKKNEEFTRYRKIKDDPRVTIVGKIIRKTSLDEFPQFINILKGEMSLVGPRPYLFREKRAMEDAYEEIIKVKPGLTGPWQVSGRSEMSLKERIELETEYVKECSLKKDIEYFLNTFPKLLKKGSAI